MPTITTRESKRNPGELRYVVRVRDPEPPPGRSGFTSATFATEPEAERFVRDAEDRGVAWALAEYRRDKGVDSITLDECAEKPFRALTEPSGATVRRYRTIYATCWKPTLGHLPLTTISRTHVSTALNAVASSDKTRKN